MTRFDLRRKTAVLGMALLTSIAVATPALAADDWISGYRSTTTNSQNLPVFNLQAGWQECGRTDVDNNSGNTYFWTLWQRYQFRPDTDRLASSGAGFQGQEVTCRDTGLPESGEFYFSHVFGGTSGWTFYIDAIH